MASQDDNSTSPWEEVLEIPEDTKPKIFGSLDNTTENVSPESQKLKVPDNIPAGVGSKVPAAQVVAKQAEAPLKTEVPKPVVPQGEILQPKPAVPPPQVPAKEIPISRPEPEIPRPAVPSSLSPPSSQPTFAPVLSPPQPSKPSTPIMPSPPVPKPVMPKKQFLKSIFPRRSVDNFAKPKPLEPIIKPPETGKAQALLPQPKTTKDSQIAASTVARFSNLPGKIKGFFLKPKLIIVAIIIVLAVGLVYFNETGLLSTGVEKVYGIFRLESLWGGLPADPQLALAKSFQKMQTQQSFKLESKVKFTVNKNSESKITKPLFSLKSPLFLVALDKAILAVSDPSQDSQLLDTSSSTGAAADSSSVQAPSTDAVSQDGQTQTDQTGTVSTNSDQSTIKEFSASANFYFSAKGSSAQVEVTDESSKKSTVNLLSQSSRLYVRSTNVNYAGSSKDWVSYQLPSSDKETLPSIFDSPDLNGFSVTGNRLGSGKINGIPVYRYQVSIKIGSLLSKIGIKDEMVNSITGEIDIGKGDQLIHYLNLTINPAVNSSISRIDFEAATKDFNIEEALNIPSSSTQTTETPATPPTVSTTPAVSSASPELLARDAQRKTDLKKIESALASYQAKNGQYPSTSDNIIQTRTKGNALSRALVPKYLVTMPVDPWTDKYYYGYKSDGTSYELSAVLGDNSDTEGTLSSGVNIYIIKH